MRRRHRYFERRPIYGSQRARLVSLLGLLVLVVLVIRQTSNPANFGWLDDEPVAAEEAVAQAPDPAPSNESSEQASGPTDQDAEELDAAREEFQALSDRTLFLQPEEMPAYNRLVRWARNQSFAAMWKRAKKNPLLNDFIQSPDRFRGQLVALDLNVRRVLKYEEDAQGNRLEEKLYEVWGFTTESKAWLYEVVAVDVPKGMPIGPNVTERARVVGYFYKLQAYHQANAKPNEAPLFAPLLIGRVDWVRPKPMPLARTDWMMIGALGALFGVIVIGAVAWTVFFRRRAVPDPALRPTTSPDAWLDQAAEGQLPPDGNSDDDWNEDQDSQPKRDED